MKYMLMMNAPRATATGTWRRGRRRTSRRHIAFMKDFAQELHASGELVGAEGLASPGAGAHRPRGKAGAPEVTDGPFAEGEGVPRRLLDRGRARRPSAPTRSPPARRPRPGPGGEPLNMPIEVREVMSGPPEI